jgi:phage terminase large subunit-like protein
MDAVAPSDRTPHRYHRPRPDRREMTARLDLTMDSLVRREMDRLLADTFKRHTWEPLPHQVPPPGQWFGWALLGGRGIGKTDAGAAYMCEHVKGPRCLPGPEPHRMAIVAPTLDDAAYSCYQGPTGIRAHDPATIKVTTSGGTLVKWPNGSYAKLFGTDTEKSTDRLRAGGNNCLVWAEELAAWRWLDLGWAHMLFGLRAGPNPRWVATTTPRPRELIKQIDKGELDDVVKTHATTDENPHLLPSLRKRYYGMYGGTALGEQELRGRVVDADKNALWKREQIARSRLTPDLAPRDLMSRIAVGVDPSGGVGTIGIVVVGKARLIIERDGMREAIDRGFVLDDRSYKPPPQTDERLSSDEWGRRAVQAAVDWEADEIVVEVNFGGDMAMGTIIGAAKAMGVMIAVRQERASRGKRVRAEPVAALAARGCLPHVGIFEELEDQLTMWTPEADYSPDRLDALVWAVVRLGLVPMTFNAASALPGPEVLGRSISPFREERRR